MPSIESIVKTRRATLSYSYRTYLARVLWSFLNVFFSLTPRCLYSVRSVVLRLFGAQIGRGVRIDPTCKIYFPWQLIVEDYASIGRYAVIDNPGLIHISSGVAISHYSHICSGTHDYTKSTMPLLRLPVYIKSNVWIGTRAFIGPGVVIGKEAVVGACSCVLRDVPEYAVVTGNPAFRIHTRSFSV